MKNYALIFLDEAPKEVVAAIKAAKLSATKLAAVNVRMTDLQTKILALNDEFNAANKEVTFANLALDAEVEKWTASKDPGHIVADQAKVK